MMLTYWVLGKGVPASELKYLIGKSSDTIQTPKTPTPQSTRQVSHHSNLVAVVYAMKLANKNLANSISTRTFKNDLISC